MKTFRANIWPVLAGLIVAFVVMTLFEFGNSFFYPLPAGLDTSDPEAVRAFTASLPATAYILVLLGWIAGSFAAGYVATRFSGESTYRHSFAVGIILTLLGVLNNFAIGHDVIFNVIALPMFLIFTYLGHRYRLSAKHVSIPHNAKTTP